MNSAQEAHLRLLSGPLKDCIRDVTHEDPPEESDTDWGMGTARRPQGGSAGTRIRFGHRVFPSITQAAKGLHVATRTLYRMLGDGRAQYVDASG